MSDTEPMTVKKFEVVRELWRDKGVFVADADAIHAALVEREKFARWFQRATALILEMPYRAEGETDA